MKSHTVIRTHNNNDIELEPIGYSSDGAVKITLKGRCAVGVSDTAMFLTVGEIDEFMVHLVAARDVLKLPRKEYRGYK